MLLRFNWIVTGFSHIWQPRPNGEKVNSPQLNAWGETTGTTQSWNGAISVVACSFLRVGLIGYMVTASITSIADEWDVCCVFDILTVIGWSEGPRHILKADQRFLCWWYDDGNYWPLQAKLCTTRWKGNLSNFDTQCWKRHTRCKFPHSNSHSVYQVNKSIS